ncbi:MAG: porin family protein [Candidatus Zixiibacteriota bacterium]
MRRFAVLFLLALSFTIFAQSGSYDFATSGLTQGGFKFGVGATSIRPEGEKVTIEGYTPQISGRFGFFFTINFVEYVAIEPGLAFGLKHGTADYMENTISPWPPRFEDATMLITHLEFPLLFKFMYNLEDAGIQPVMFIGPVFNYNVYHHFSYDLYEDDDYYNANEIKDVQGFDMSLATGIGSEFAVGKGRMILNFRYDIGMSSVVHGNEDYEVLTDVFTAEIGYAFRR